jgi:hypothetical protein
MLKNWRRTRAGWINLRVAKQLGKGLRGWPSCDDGGVEDWNNGIMEYWKDGLSGYQSVYYKM